MCRENNLRLRQAGVFADFRGVAVRKEIVSLEIFIQLGKLQIASRFFARSGRAGFAIAHNARAGSDPACLGEWTNRQNHACGVAAGIGHQLGLRNLRCIKFRQSINSLAEPGGMRRGQFVPALKRFCIVKAERRT